MKKHEHKWKLVCTNCELEDGDDVYECDCGEGKYVGMAEKVEMAKKYPSDKEHAPHH